MASRLGVRSLVIARALWFMATSKRSRFPEQPRRILIAHHLLLGDTLMLTPLLAKLREHYPDAQIIMTVPKPIFPLYQKIPYGVQAILFDPRDLTTAQSLFKESGFDLAIVPGDNRYSWLARAADSAWIVAFGGDRPAYKSWPIDELIFYPQQAAAWGDMVANLIPGPPPRPYDARDWVQPDFQSFELPKTPYCVLHLGASSPLKLWPNENWNVVANHMRSLGYAVVWSGGKGEEKLLEGIQLEKKDFNFIGKLDLPQLWQLLKQAALLICPDTGVAHLGRIVDTPTIALFGPGSAVICGKGLFWQNAKYQALTVEDFACRDQRTLFKREIDWVRRCSRTLRECPRPACMESIAASLVLNNANAFLHHKIEQPPPQSHALH